MKKTKLLLLTTLILFTWQGYSQNAKTVVKEMGWGFNLGNSWDRGNQPRTDTELIPFIDKYKLAGARHVRIPVTWITPLAGGDNSVMVVESSNWIQNINASHNYLEELKQTIDYCISQGLYVIINTHHEEWIKDHYSESTSADLTAKFKKLWRFIAEEFNSYSKKLIFEVMNEPEGNFGVDDGPGGFPAPNTINSLWTRNINQAGYDAIRDTGGNNSTRIIMVSPNGQSADQLIKNVWPTASTLPGGGNDSNLAIQVHSYDPWGFCGPEGSSSYYTGTYGNDLSAKIKAEVEAAAAAAASLNNVALHYGEFGVGRSGSQSDRDDDRVRNWHRALVETCINNDIAVTIWDDRGYYRYISDNAQSWTYDIVPYMIANLDIIGRYYQLENVYAGANKMLRAINHATVSNSGVKIDDDAGTTNSSQWEFELAKNFGYYYIRNKSTNELLVADYVTGTPTVVTLKLQDNTTTNRDYNRAQWKLEANGTNSYNIINKWLNHALRPLDASQSNASNADDAQVYGYLLDTGWSSQRWILKPMGVASKNSNSKTLSTEEEALGNTNFRVYPNPVKDMLNISIPNSNNNILEIYSILGKRVYKQSVKGLDKLQINVNNFSKGIYFIRLNGPEVLNVKVLFE